MKLAWILWLASVMPPSVADPLCLATTIYLEARNQSQLGQRAVAEVALRRLDSGRWGDSMCAVVTAPKQFAPTLISPAFRLDNLKAWNNSVAIAFRSQKVWAIPSQSRPLVVPGADHFLAHQIAEADWARGVPVAQIGDHTFYRVINNRSVKDPALRNRPVERRTVDSFSVGVPNIESQLASKKL